MVNLRVSMLFTLIISYSIWAETLPQIPDVQKFLSPLNSPCIGCSEGNANSVDPLCEDLYKVACEDKQEAIKKEYEELELLPRKAILDLRNDEAKRLGYIDFKDLLIKRMDKADIPLSKYISDTDWKKILSGELNDLDDIGTIFSHPCIEKIKALNLEYDAKLTEISEKEASSLYKKLMTTLDETRNKTFAFLAEQNNFQEFYDKFIKERCQAIKNTNRYTQESNKEFREICSPSGISKIRREASDAYRSDSNTERDAFIKKYGFYELVDVDKPSSELAIVVKALANAQEFCSPYQEVDNERWKTAIVLEFGMMNMTKPFIDSLLGTFYNQNKKGKVFEDFKMIKGLVKKSLSQIVSDSKKLEKISKEYDVMELRWFDPPSDDKYKKYANIDQLYIDKPLIELSSDSLYKFLGDTSLSSFLELNANYAGNETYGELKSLERVEMMPLYFLLYDRYRYKLLGTLAHELFHKVGPKMALINGHDISEDTKSLVECLEESGSIKISQDQKGEAFSDYLAAEVLAEFMMNLSSSERRALAISVAEKFCLFDQNTNKDFSFDLTADHPVNILRVNGIFGAQPSFRKALGCQGESKKYKSCYLPSHKEKK